ncbi:MAG: hypothetical protein FWG64_10340 [Firmicutes bacterium]|nr:hypothetical protein [Bacillota bacterium]
MDFEKVDKTDEFTKLAHNKDSVFKDSFTLFLNRSLEFLDADLEGQILEILPACRTGRSPETTAVEAIGDLAVKIFSEILGTFGVHKEFETHISKDDLMRFGGYNLYLSRKHKIPFTTIIITENKPTVTEYTNKSIAFNPKIIYLKERDGDATLQKIRERVANGEPINELELVYLPLYGSKQGTTMYDFLSAALKLTPQIGETATTSKKLQMLLIFLTIRNADKEQIKKILEDNMDILKNNAGIQALMEIGEDRSKEKWTEKGREEGMLLGEKKNRNETLSIIDDLISKGFTLKDAREHLLSIT